MIGIHIEAFDRSMARDASGVLARAFVTNPLHIAAFGPSELAKNEAFFEIALAVMRGAKRVAMEGSQILGLIHWVRSPDCEFSGLEKLRMAPAMVKGFGVSSALRVSSWFSVWSKHDPREPHSHLGPIGVSPEVQGRHIGRRLMEAYCEDLDQTADAGYLETDRSENVEFYRRFDFDIIHEATVLGVRNYFMWRKPTSKPPSNMRLHPTYVSGCNLKSGLGKMYGTYEMERMFDGKKFSVQIPEFTMVVPFRLN